MNVLHCERAANEVAAGLNMKLPRLSAVHQTLLES